MTDLHHPCELWSEPISLAAAGCLSPDDEREMQRHVDSCADCRERLAQLTRLCGALAIAAWPADAAENTVVERVLSAVAAEQSQGPLAGNRAEGIHRMRRALSLDTWRWIMRSPVSRVAAAIVFAVVVSLASGMYPASRAAKLDPVQALRYE